MATKSMSVLLFKLLQKVNINTKCFVISSELIETELYNIPEKMEGVNFLRFNGLIVVMKYEY